MAPRSPENQMTACSWTLMRFSGERQQLASAASGKTEQTRESRQMAMVRQMKAGSMGTRSLASGCTHGVMSGKVSPLAVVHVLGAPAADARMSGGVPPMV